MTGSPRANGQHARELDAAADFLRRREQALAAPAGPVPDAHVAALLAALAGVEPEGRGWKAQCPAHDDGFAALRVHQARDGRIIVHCRAGCPTERIVWAIGLRLADLFPPIGSQSTAARTRWRLDEVFADASLMEPPRVVVPRLAWAARSTLLGAGEKLGKSTKTRAVTAAVSRGGVYLDEPCNGGNPGDVLVVGLEEFIGDAARGLRDFGADPTRVHLVDRLPGDPRLRPQALRRHVEEVTPVLLVLDSLIAYAGDGVTDASSSSQMGPLVQAITDLAHESGTSVIVVHHARKADGRYRDSSAIGAAVDVIAEMFAPEEDADPSLRTVRVRGRVPCATFSVRFDGRTYTLVSNGAVPLEQRVVEFLRANPGASQNRVCQAIGGRAADIRATLTRLVDTGRLVDQGTGDTVHRYRVPQFNGTNADEGGE